MVHLPWHLTKVSKFWLSAIITLTIQLSCTKGVFVSFNPFNVFVAQADVKPACVLRPSNGVPILRDRKLINDKEVVACKQKMNTWAFVGDLSDMPQISCVYQSDDAQNEFLSDNPKLGIGEDVWDDDRMRMATDKKVKSIVQRYEN